MWLSVCRMRCCRKPLFGLGARDFILYYISTSILVVECSCTFNAHATAQRVRRLMTHLGLKASMPTSSYVLVAFFASSFSSSAMYASSFRSLAMVGDCCWGGEEGSQKSDLEIPGGHVK